MSVIIRLQNLPWSANALDIRQYFTGLSIPEGGVHIVGGELGDAFIAFSTDEDARQAFTRNNGKIKEVQITLMLSSRTEMQRVIEAARAQSYAAFMQPAAVPMPAAVPPIAPAPVPEIKKETKESKPEKRESRRRSRSKSRDRKDRSRERDRKDKRHRDRSRSRSRDRKDRRRRDRSRSRGRSRSRDRDRRSSRDHRKRSEEKVVPVFQRDMRKAMPEVWANQNQNKLPLEVSPTPSLPTALVSNFINLERAKRTLSSLAGGLQANGFASNNNSPNFNNSPQERSRDSWPPTGNFQNRSGDVFQNKRQMGPGGDNFQGRFQRNNFQRNDGIHGNNRNNMEDDYHSDCCVSLEPFYGSYGEVRRFFQGLFISNRGIKFINDTSGHRTGVVYIQFANRKSKDEALTLNGEVLSGITVAVLHLEDSDFDAAVDRFIPIIHIDDDMNDGPPIFKHRTKYFNNPPAEPEIKDFTSLIVDDLPTYCKEQDILHIFSQHPLVALLLTTKPRGGNIAYVKFSSKDVAKNALEEKNHHVIGGKQVTVRPCKDEEFDEINKKHEEALTGTAEPQEDIGTDCLSLSQLPTKTTDKDIADFFSDIGIIPTKIHLMSNNMGFTGQAYCEFITVEEATQAAKKDETMLGNVPVSVKPIDREEMEGILGNSLPSSALPTLEEVAVPAMKPQALLKPGLAPPLNSPIPGQQMQMPMNPRPFFRGGFDGRPTRGPRFGPRGMTGPRHRFPLQEQFDEMPPEGCTVFMKNVPYKAGTNEILDFFEGYNITNNVSRRYNPNNTPSDEAKVIFFDPDEAFRAVQDLHHKQIWDRQIFLRQE